MGWRREQPRLTAAAVGRVRSVARFSRRNPQERAERERELVRVSEWKGPGLVARPVVLETGLRRRGMTTGVAVTAGGFTAHLRADELREFCEGRVEIIETTAAHSPLMFLARAGSADPDSRAWRSMRQLPAGSAALMPADEEMRPVVVIEGAMLVDLGSWTAELPTLG